MESIHEGISKTIIRFLLHLLVVVHLEEQGFKFSVRSFNSGMGEGDGLACSNLASI